MCSSSSTTEAVTGLNGTPSPFVTSKDEIPSSNLDSAVVNQIKACKRKPKTELSELSNNGVLFASDSSAEVSDPRSVDTNNLDGQSSKKAKKLDWTDGYYFDSYAHHQIHEMMLKDRVRTLTYRDSICNNTHLFKGKIVLDVGCGTGILSMFAAKAGAAKVIGIDMSDIAKYARQIVKDNHLDSIITIIQGKVEDTELPDGIEKVDIIISEWMGYCLLLESMLETVLYARDKWLKYNGLIFPDKVSLWIAGIHDKPRKNDRVDWLNTFEDFDMTNVVQNIMHKGHVCQVDANQVATNHYELLEFDLKTVYKEELSFTVPFSLEALYNQTIDALVTFFTVNFSACLKKTGFSTSPESQQTHWHQTVFYLKKFAHVHKGEVIKGTLRMDKSPLNRRGLDIWIEFNFDGYLHSLHEYNRYALI